MKKLVATTAVNTAKLPQLRTLTGLRGFAALAVAFSHATGAPYVPLLSAAETYGWIAVPFFFCLSGFVMTWTWNRGGSRFFYRKRFARIWPMAMLGLVASLVAYHVTHDNYVASGGYIGPPRSILYDVFLVQSWSNDPFIRQSWDGVMWTLSCEMFFYAISPFVLPRILKAKLGSCVAFAAALFVIDVIVQFALSPHLGQSEQDFLYLSPVAGVVFYLIGTAGCRFILSGKRPQVQSLLLALGVLIVPLEIYAHCVPTNRLYGEMAVIGFPGIFLLVLIAASKDLAAKWTVPSRRAFVFLGEVSYSLYATHVVVLGCMQVWYNDHQFSPRSGLFEQAYIVWFLLLAVAVATVCHFGFEIPMQRVILRLTTRWSAAQISDSPVALLNEVEAVPAFESS